MHGLSTPAEGGISGLPAIWRVLVRNELRVLLRNRTALFWVFLFPLLLFFTLGLALSGGGRIGVEVVDNSGTSEGAALATYLRDELVHYTRSDYAFVVPGTGKARPRLSVETVRALASGVPTLQVRLDIAGRLVPGATTALEQAVQNLLRDQALGQHAISAAPLVSGVREESETQAYRRFLFSGVLVLMLLSGGLLSVALMLIGQREQGILCLPAVWPIHPRAWLCAVLGTRGAVLVVAALTFLILGHLLLDMGVRVSPMRILDTVVILSLGVVAFLSMGHAVAARCGSSATAELVANSLYYPMLLLGDLTIPLRELPFGIDRVLVWLPTTQIAGGIRAALWAPVHDAPAWTLYGYLVIAAALSFLIAGKGFKFSDRGGT
ncbi:ABC transporter permease [Xanthomonas hydrangeae]|uniref:ABC transporter permease n=1 Tax=Xanthomonas hydrangeae TaxID=2775159 RepID=A0AAU0B4Q3_9XANT|nr:ABC transporter permease [Xanthomonas hydrangeae]WOB47932.1 ABC transporter permease [Xanthomonas hydrangeae]